MLKPGRFRFFKPVLMMGLGAVIVASALAAEKKSETKSKKTASDSKAVQLKNTEAVPYTSNNPVVKTAAQMGVNTCLKRIDQITSFLAKNADAGTFLFPATSNPDKSLFSTSMEVLASNTLAYASASFAPVGTDGCGALYEAVTYWPTNCQQTAAQGFAQLKAVGAIKRNIFILDGGPNMRVFLMPAGTGCVAIKKEVVF
jgi:hypothetical protein